MAELTADQIYDRLEALRHGLSGLAANDLVPWTVARVFNALLQQATPSLTGDPVMVQVARLKPLRDDQEIQTSTTTVGALTILVGQTLVALRPYTANQP